MLIKTAFDPLPLHIIAALLSEWLLFAFCYCGHFEVNFTQPWVQILSKHKNFKEFAKGLFFRYLKYLFRYFQNLPCQKLLLCFGNILDLSVFQFIWNCMFHVSCFRSEEIKSVMHKIERRKLLKTPKISFLLTFPSLIQKTQNQK